MASVRPGKYNRWVTLANAPQTGGDADGFFTPLNPETVPCAMQPAAGGSDGRVSASLIEMRFHPGVTVDTKISYVDPVRGTTRDFFVRGVQNVDEANVVLRLDCEEIAP